MPANVGTADRAVRLLLGIVLIAVAFVPSLPPASHILLQWAMAGAGAVLIVTALVRFCPLYAIFGISSCKVSTR